MKPNQSYLIKLDIKLPQFIGHKFKPCGVYNLSYLQTDAAKEHRRLKCFSFKGTTCVKCGIKGVYLIEGIDRFGNSHLDLYTSDFKLMTVDHIIPLSKGGNRTNINNLQPMCSECNTKKSNNIEIE